MKKIDVKFRNPYNNCILSKIIFHQYLPKFIRTFDLMGSQTDRFRYEVFQNLILRPINTGFLRPAVATVPTVYGIETIWRLWCYNPRCCSVATVPTVYGIETIARFDPHRLNFFVATVPTVYGIETR